MTQEDKPAGEPSGERIGRALMRSGSVRTGALAIGVAVVAADLAISSAYQRRPDLYHALSYARAGLGAFGIVALGFLTRWDWASLGLRVGSIQPLRYWLKATSIIGLIVGGVTGLTFCVLWVGGWEASVQPAFQNASQILPWLGQACIVFPILEEIVYRLVLCVCFGAVFGRWPAIVLSGLLFAFLHVVYGSIAPTNAVAGFVLAWAYFKSGSLDVPIILHAAGNLCVGLFHIGLLIYAA